MNKVHLSVDHLLNVIGKETILDIIFTGSRMNHNLHEASDYDFIVVLKDNNHRQEMIKLCQNLSLYSKYPIDLIVTSWDLIHNTGPLSAYSSLFNYLRIPGLASTKISLPPFDPFLYKASQIKVLTKTIALKGFKSIRHLKKTLSFYQVSLTDKSNMHDKICHYDYEQDFQHLSFAPHLLKNNFIINSEIKNLIITDLQSQLQLLYSDVENWQKYSFSPLGMDDIFFKAALKASSIKEIYYQTISSLLETAKSEAP